VLHAAQQIAWLVEAGADESKGFGVCCCSAYGWEQPADFFADRLCQRAACLEAIEGVCVVCVLCSVHVQRCSGSTEAPCLTLSHPFAKREAAADALGWVGPGGSAPAAASNQ
jgi:hypothetical protein